MGDTGACLREPGGQAGVMYSVSQWKKLTNHERNVVLQKLKLPYDADRNQYFTGTGKVRETPCTLDEVLDAVNAALRAEADKKAGYIGF